MYLSFYNLKDKPFQMSTDPHYLWLGEKHKEALAMLKYAFYGNKGVLALTGDVGTGKTTLINALIKSLGKDDLAATIYDPGLEILEFFNIIADAYNMDRTFDSKGEFLIHFKQFLKKARARNQKVLLVIDEAQRIYHELLEEIRLLSNLEEKHVRLLNIFFVGQNEFIDILQENKNRALSQRITINYNLEPLTPSETKAYINHRLKVAGAKAPIFKSETIHEIIAFSRGFPRLINIICDHALLTGYVKEVKIIDTNIIMECRKELLISEQIPLQDTDYPDDAYELRRHRIPLVPPESGPVPIKTRIVPAALGIAFLALIVIAASYVYYDTGKTKAESLGTVALKSNGASYSMQADSKKDEPTIVPPEPEAPDVPIKVKAEEVDNSRAFVAKASETESLKEITKEEVKIPAAMPSDRTAAQPDRQIMADGQRESGKESQGLMPGLASEFETSNQPAVTLESQKQSKKLLTPVPKPAQPRINSKTSKAVKKDTRVKKPKKTALKAQQRRKSVASVSDKVVQKNLQHRLKAFLANYCRAYEDMRLDKFTTFFTRNATEKGTLFRSLLPKYRRNFERIASIDYRIELQRYAVQEDTGFIKIEGIYYAKARLASDKRKLLQGSGEISMELVPYGDSFQVRRLDY